MSALNVRPMIGWQTLLADLALILFMVTAAAMAASPPNDPHPKPAKIRPEHATTEPIAVWRAGGTAPPLGRWLREEAPDPRQQLTIAVRYAPGGLPAALARATQLAAEAQATGVAARVLVEPGADEAVATLAYDRVGDRVGTGVAGQGH